MYDLTVVAQKLRNNKTKPDWRHAETLYSNLENRGLVAHRYIYALTLWTRITAKKPGVSEKYGSCI